MKKKAVVLCMAVSFALTACNSKAEVQESSAVAIVESEAEEESEIGTETETETETEEVAEGKGNRSGFEKGELTDTGWESEWLGMRYVMGDGMTMSTEEELDAIMGISQEMLSEDFNERQMKYAELNTLYEMMCTASDGASNINVTLEKLPVKVDVDTYMEAFKFQTSQVSVMSIRVVSDGEDVTVAGKDFKKLQCEVEYEGATLCQDYYMTIVEDRAMTIVISYLDETVADELLSGFQAY